MPNPRLPDNIKRLRGTFRDDRVDPDRLQVEPCRIPNAPKQMKDDERQIWSDLRKVLQPLGVVGETDLISFRLMVKAYARAFRLLDDPDGLVDPGPAMDRALKWASHFGLTPQSRTTVRMVAGPEAEQTLDDFLKN